MPPADAYLAKSDLVLIRNRLIKWFQTNRRDLPWRVSRDPYRIWVSEVMLQQTQVAAVIPFFRRFMERFPTIADLAAASEQEVLRAWEGLGYYRRARHLHAAARIITQKHKGLFPDDPEIAAGLPGLGRYTVGAVLSQAFDRRLPVVDANVARVLTRLGGWDKPLERRETQQWLWQLAETLLPKRGVGDFNQALMELGQTICIPQQPSCLLCPLREVCRGRALGIAGHLPKRAEKLATVEVQEVAFVIRRGEEVLLAQRKPDAPRWASMWEFPTTVIESSEDLSRTSATLCKKLTGIRISRPCSFGMLRYGVTRFRMRLYGISSSYASGVERSENYQVLLWVLLSRLSEYPLSIPQRRLIKAWQESRRSGHR